MDGRTTFEEGRLTMHHITHDLEYIVEPVMDHGRNVNIIESRPKTIRRDRFHIVVRAMRSVGDRQVETDGGRTRYARRARLKVKRDSSKMAHKSHDNMTLTSHTCLRDN